MTYFASLALVFVLIVRPQEIWPWMEAFRLLDVLTAVVVVGLVAELLLQKQKKLYTPQIPFLLGFVGVCYLMTALSLGVAPATDLAMRNGLFPVIFAAAVIYGVRNLAQLKGMVALLVGLGLFTAAVAVHQGNEPAVCMAKEKNANGEVVANPELADGRECGRPSDCVTDKTTYDDWACESRGLFDTISIVRRVRWRGQLADPNELSVYLGGIISFLIAMLFPATGPSGAPPLSSRKLRLLSAVVLIGLVLYAVILTQSRGGQLVVGAVFMAYFVSRVGWKGVFLAGLLALPVLVLGGRSDPDAEGSSNERLGLLYDGVSLFMTHPLRGVGILQFSDQVDAGLTAHNSYLLAATELGLPGFYVWMGLLWTSFRIPLVAMRREALSPAVRAMAASMVVSLCGTAVGIFFLSFTYKQLLFVWFGLSGALYRVARNEDPTLTIEMGWKDYVGIGATNLGIIAALFAYTRLKGS